MSKTAKELLQHYENAIARGHPEQRLEALDNLSREMWECESQRSYTEKGAVEWHKTALVALVPALLGSMLDSDKAARLAMGVLERLQPYGFDELLSLLDHKDPEIRLRVCEGLRDWGAKAFPACRALRKATTDQDARVSAQAFLALGMTHEATSENFQVCLDGAGSPIADVRSRAIHALGNLRLANASDWSPDVREAWVNAWLKDQVADVRRSALHVLEYDGRPEKARAEAVFDLLRTEADAEVIERAVGILDQLSPDDVSDQDIARLALHLSLGPRTADEIGKFLARCLERAQMAGPELKRQIMSESCSSIHSLAIAYWRITGDTSGTVAAMQKHFDNAPEAVCDALCELGPAGVALVPKLVEAMASDDWDLQWAAADALGKVADASPQSLGALMPALAHDSALVRSASARALAALGAYALPQLIAALSSAPLKARPWAALALAEMGEAARPAMDVLRSTACSTNDGLRLWSTVALASISDDVEWVEPLAELLALDPDENDLASVCEALAKYGRRAGAAVPHLEQLARQGAERPSEAALEALQRIAGRLN